MTNTPTSYSQTKYNYHWKQVNMRPATKTKLDEITALLSKHTTVSLASILDQLVTAYHAELTSLK